MKYTVTFENIEDDTYTSIELYSHYTCILGKYSGEGKSYFYDYIENGLSDKSVEVSIEGPEHVEFTLATEASMKAILGNPNRLVILIDEAATFNSKLIKEMNESHHLFICITRAMPFKLDCPLNGLYYLKDEDGSFDIYKVPKLPLATDFTKGSTIVCESQRGKSESQLLSTYLDGVISAEGRDNLAAKVRILNGDVLVLADLGNIGRAYRLLMKRCSQNPGIRFYDYECFEQMLLESSLVSSMGNDDDIPYDEFEFFSIERYYEKALEFKTQGTSIEYKHSNPVLKKPYVDKDNFSKVFDGETAKGIKEYIEKFGNN